MERIPGLIVVSLLPLIPALIAHRKGRGFVRWWLFGYFFLLLALPAAVLVPRNRARTESPAFQKWPSPRVVTLTTALAVGIGMGLLGLREFVLEARFVAAEAMRPTFEVGDRVAVDKTTYRFFAPRRGDIVVFHPPERAYSQGQSHIKRIVALPGETVSFRDGRLHVDGKALSEDYVPEPVRYMEPDWAAIGMPGGKVPPDCYFVLGDNRNHSQDSHVFGPVPRDRLIGRASFRFWPSDRVAGI